MKIHLSETSGLINGMYMYMKNQSHIVKSMIIGTLKYRLSWMEKTFRNYTIGLRNAIQKRVHEIMKSNQTTTAKFLRNNLLILI